MKYIFVCFLMCMPVGINWAASLRKTACILPENVATVQAGFKIGRQITHFLHHQDGKQSFVPTGLTNRSYLEQIERQVRAFYPYQDKMSGAIIDPVYKIEWQYSTPCYALSVGLLSHTGFIKDEKLLRSGILALDCAIAEMHENRCAHHHGEFFIQPIMLALRLYAGNVPATQMEIWRSKLATVDPYLLYKDNLRRKKFCYNHNVVALSGEYLRMKEGISKDPAFFELHLAHQQQYLSENGLYIDNKTNPPMAYDEFTRQFLASILAEGYKGEYYAYYSGKLLNGAWSSLFMQSPYGEVPTGGRSAQHLWNEAAAAVTYEIYASQYAAAGMKKEAGAFKRAAHLALKSIARWERPDGSGYIVKNRFPIEVMHGYESYSAQSQYNLLACWLMSVAYLYADDTISELPAPADTGGFVFAMQDVFHKVFANAGGNYIEYELSGDPRYNATGLIRIHLKNTNPQLGPSDAVSHIWDNKKKQEVGGELMAVGPAWFDKDGKEHRLAEYTNICYPDTHYYSAYTAEKLPQISIRVKEESPERVKFEVVYQGDFCGVTSISQQLIIDAEGITVTDKLKGNTKGMRVYYPMLIDDGSEKTTVSFDKQGVRLFLRDGEMAFYPLYPRSATVKRTGKKLSYRNGFAEGAYFDIQGKKAVYKITCK